MSEPCSSELSMFEELAPDECYELLRSCPVGRIAVTRLDAAPLVVPVNFVLDGTAIVFRSASGSKVDALRWGPIAFQVDGIDPHRRTGWSVLVDGVAYEATHWEVQHLDLSPWAPGRKDRWVRLVPRSVTGRRIRKEFLVYDSRGYV